jgi:Zn-dependent protease
MSLIIAALLNRLLDSTSGILVVLSVLAIHELGHYLAMLAFGYRSLDVFFIPLPATVVSKNEALSRTWRHVAVLLLGPAPGLLAALLLAGLHPGFERMPQHGLLAQVLVASAVINGLNLVPFMPLDGGKAARTILFLNLPKAQLRLARSTSFIIAAFAFLAHRWDIAFVASVSFLFTLASGLTSGVAQKLRERYAREFSSAPEHAREAPVELLRLVFDEYQVASQQSRALQALQPPAVARLLGAIYSEAATPDIGIRARVTLGLAYVGMVVPCAFLLIGSLVDLMVKH